MKPYRTGSFLPRAAARAAFAAVVLLAAAFAPAAAAPGPAAEARKAGGATRPATQPATQPAKPPAKPRFILKYRPVVTETSSRREVGVARALRGAQEKDPPRVYVLAPETGAGTTTREQPTLYWYISEPTQRKVKLSLTPLSGTSRFPKPLVVVELNGVEKPGIQALDLSAAKGPDGAPVKLEKGGRYRWAVVASISETERAKNPYAGCTLARVDAPPALADAASAGGLQAAAAYAEAGVWYDALAALSRAIEAEPDDKSLREARRELLASQKLVEDEQGRVREVK